MYFTVAHIPELTMHYEVELLWLCLNVFDAACIPVFGLRQRAMIRSKNIGHTGQQKKVLIVPSGLVLDIG